MARFLVSHRLIAGLLSIASLFVQAQQPDSKGSPDQYKQQATGNKLVLTRKTDTLMPGQATFRRPEVVFVGGGKFKMGSKLGAADEQPVHEVTLDDFYIGKFEVTQSEWNLVMAGDTNKRYFEGCDSCPVERVSWYNVMEFIDKLNATTSANYRLPTEAEWEFAARGGNYSKGYKYSGSHSDDSVAWKVGNAGNMTHPAGLKKPNELGIYDMTGNVFEWCADWFSPDWYQVSPAENPSGPGDGDFRVIRGGSWFYDFAGLRTTDRESANPSYRYGYIGFRLCRSANDEQPKQVVPEKPRTKKDSRDASKNPTYKKFIGF
jgi:formylglycine-generating enzyme required for sulfatase activity